MGFQKLALCLFFASLMQLGVASQAQQGLSCNGIFVLDTSAKNLTINTGDLFLSNTEMQKLRQRLANARSWNEKFNIFYELTSAQSPNIFTSVPDALLLLASNVVSDVGSFSQLNRDDLRYVEDHNLELSLTDLLEDLQPKKPDASLWSRLKSLNIFDRKGAPVNETRFEHSLERTQVLLAEQWGLVNMRRYLLSESGQIQADIYDEEAKQILAQYQRLVEEISQVRHLILVAQQEVRLGIAQPEVAAMVVDAKRSGTAANVAQGLSDFHQRLSKKEKLLKELAISITESIRAIGYDVERRH